MGGDKEGYCILIPTLDVVMHSPSLALSWAAVSIRSVTLLPTGGWPLAADLTTCTT